MRCTNCKRAFITKTKRVYRIASRLLLLLLQIRVYMMHYFFCLLLLLLLVFCRLDTNNADFACVGAFFAFKCDWWIFIWNLVKNLQQNNNNKRVYKKILQKYPLVYKYVLTSAIKMNSKCVASSVRHYSFCS